MHYVPQISPGYPAEPYSSPAAARDALEEGRAIRWEPGTGSGYDLLLVSRKRGQGAEQDNQRWLMVVTTPDAHYAIALHEKWTARDWARNKTVPHGSWAELKPILVALGAAEQRGTGPFNYARERHAELSARQEYNDGRPLDNKDAQLGRRFRRLMEAELAHELRHTREDPDVSQTTA